jgi:regulator of replication initiation timing
MSLTKEVEEAIKKNLSSEVAGVLKNFIAEAESNKYEIVQYKKQLDSKKEETARLYTEKGNLQLELESLTKELDEFKKREEITANAELRIVHAGFEAQKAQAVAETYKECFGIVFRNTQVKRTVTGVENLPTSITQPGGYSTSSSIPMKLDKTITTEEIG